MPNSDLSTILALALKSADKSDIERLTSKDHQEREEANLRVAMALEAQLLRHFDVKRKPMRFNG